MALNSSTVAAGDATLASQYNNLRKDVLYNAGDYGVTTGGPTVYAVTLDTSITALIDGMVIKVRVNTTNSGAVTLNTNGIGPVSVVKTDGTTLATDEWVADADYFLIYNSALTAWQLVNAPAGSAGLTYITSVTYDSNGDLTAFTADGVGWTCTYDGDGNLLTWNNGITTFTVTRNKDGQLISVS